MSTRGRGRAGCGRWPGGRHGGGEELILHRTDFHLHALEQFLSDRRHSAGRAIRLATYWTTMFLPAIFNYRREQRLPQLGEHSEWHVSWNSKSADLWAGLRPEWRLNAALQIRHDQTITSIAGQKQPLLAAIATSGEVQIDCRVYGSVPANITLSGAVHITGRVGEDDPDRRGLPPRPVTAATVTRMQLVSVVFDHRPSINIDIPDPSRQYTNLQPIAGTEWFYELAQPPRQLHTYRPHDREVGQLRQELLLLDLDTTS